MVKKTLRIAGMDCVSCALLIEGELEDRGVHAACSYAKSEVAVEYDPTMVKDEEIVAAIKRAGYNVVAPEGVLA